MLNGLSGSGWHLCSIMMRMMFDGYIGRTASLGSPGVNELRWLAPLRPGDDLMLDIDLAEASRSDMLKHTVSYDKVVQTATEAFCSRRYRLVEAAAGAVAETVLERYPQVRRIRVTVHKPHAPIAATFDDVGVIIERTRQERGRG